MNRVDKRKICVVLVDRANYGRMKPVMQAIKSHPKLELQLIATGTMVLKRFDQPVLLLQKDGFQVDGQIFIELEGSTPTTMAKSVGFAIIEFSSEFNRLKPDVLLVIGDRYEALSAVIAAAYMNICICHIQGGEVSGSIDESARHAISKFAHYHFPATQRSAKYLIKMGENPDTILGIGCPSSDIACSLDTTLKEEYFNQRGSGIVIDILKPFLLVVFHPTTTEYGNERQQILEVLEALNSVNIQTLMLWPNIDAGSDFISKEIRIYRDNHAIKWLRIITNLEPETYQKILATSACAVGNSSSFVRDAGFFGTPVVLVGRRQEGRENDSNVMRVPCENVAIANAVKKQIEHGRHPPSQLYGKGYVSTKIADELSLLKIYNQKRLHYIYEI